MQLLELLITSAFFSAVIKNLVLFHSVIIIATSNAQNGQILSILGVMSRGNYAFGVNVIVATVTYRVTYRPKQLLYVNCLRRSVAR